MQSTLSVYNHVPQILGNGTVDWDSDTLKLALLTSSYTFSAEHTVFADVAASELTSSGTGYVAGGVALSNTSVLRSGTTTKFDADDCSISGVTSGAIRYGVLYADVVRNGLTKPLIALVLFDSTPSDVTLSGGMFPIVWHIDGIIKNVVG